MTGGNRIKKAFPWYYDDMATSDAEFALLKKMGVNAVRLGYMWTGVAPRAGYYNGTYVAVVKGIVARMAAHGIYALLDMHQDVLSSKFCLYDGAPRWVIDKSVPRHAFPWPLEGNCSSRPWGANEVTEAAATAYQDIYDNNHGMLDDLSAFWAYSAEQFKDEPAVLGYEVINEPFAGNFYADPLVLLPGVAGKQNLARVYGNVSKAIRAHDDRHLLFYEPVTWGMLFNGSIVGSGFDQVPGGPAYRNRSAFSYHYYCSTFVPGWQRRPSLRKLVCDDVTGPLVFEAVARDLARVGGAQMMTEGIARRDFCRLRGTFFSDRTHCSVAQQLRHPDPHSCWVLFVLPRQACGDNNTECAFVMGLLDDRLYSYTSYADAQDSPFAPAASMQAAPVEMLQRNTVSGRTRCALHS